ncbi:hypothetical protein [Paracoccus sp. SSK6]|uniref:hypothetical protein n=1 Tax=Paracoccus sp. SSK6 TaxID=3143131 RepID=UPI00321AF510
MQHEPMQDIFEGAEAATDAIHNASGCTRAILALIDQLTSGDDEMAHQTMAMLAATDLFLTDARKQVDRITRLSMERRG